MSGARGTDLARSGSFGPIALLELVESCRCKRHELSALVLTVVAQSRDIRFWQSWFGNHERCIRTIFAGTVVLRTVFVRRVFDGAIGSGPIWFITDTIRVGTALFRLHRGSPPDSALPSCYSGRCHRPTFRLAQKHSRPLSRHRRGRCRGGSRCRTSDGRMGCGRIAVAQYRLLPPDQGSGTAPQPAALRLRVPGTFARPALHDPALGGNQPTGTIVARIAGDQFSAGKTSFPGGRSRHAPSGRNSRSRAN